MADLEKNKSNSEQIKDREGLERAGAERHEELREKLEQTGERPKEKLEDVTREALEKAKALERDHSHKKSERETSPAERRKDGPISKKEREASYKRTMKQVQDELPAPSRAFSKVIHNKVIEKASDVIGGTVARPNAILAGSIAAFVLTLAIFLVARYYGYPLSGAETIAAFIVGWLVGLLYDYLRLEITGKKS
jgi:hypothetical protein